MKLENRKWLFKTLVGSHNYGLNTETSDKDYKAFVLPTFDDLYYGEKVSKSITSDEEDISIHDIRMLTNMLYKSNVNFIEVLFSKEFDINSEFLFTETHDFLIKLRRNREKYAKMNLPYLWNACIGMYYQNRKKMMYITLTVNDKNLKLYDTKKAMTAYRILDFLERYASFLQNDICEPFKHAIDYSPANNYFHVREIDQDFLLSIRNGEFSLTGIEKLLDEKLEQVEANFKDFYLESKIDEELKLELEKEIKQLIYENI